MTNSSAVSHLSNAIISLREVTRENIYAVLDLALAEEQQYLVAPPARSIAEAHFFPELMTYRAIYANETPVGFLMLYHDHEGYFLMRFLIDARYQRLGIGRQAVRRLIAHLQSLPGVTELRLSCGPCHFWEKLGFVYTGEVEHGEPVLKCAW
jgi:diamine N-acetyltransferase